MAASLSFGAEQLLGTLERLVVGEAPPEGWLSALAEHDQPLVEAEAGGRDLDALVRQGPDEDATALTRADVGALATQFAGADGREVASTSDVAAALVAAVAPPPEITEPDVPQPSAGAADEEATGVDEGTPEKLPLSFAAAQLLASLQTNGLGLYDLLVTLAEEHDDLLHATDVDLDASSAAAGARLCREAGDVGERWDTDRVTTNASAQAHEAGRTVIAPQDVAAALLQGGAAAFSTDRADRPYDASDQTASELRASEPEKPTPAQVAPVAEADVTTRRPESVDLHGREPVTATAEPEDASVTGGRPRTFRVFVSSTFKDLEQERNALRELVYPKLSKYCATKNARFQAIDLRWGVSEEASLDQQAMSICLSEIERCREITPRPNFLVLLGNRYGWLALPAHIPKPEFERIRGRVGGTDLELLESWYEFDGNAVPDPGQEPGEYRLLPRVGPSAPRGHEPTEPLGDRPIEKRTRKKAEQTKWLAVEKELRRILTGAVKDSELSDDRRPVYRASATEQEIRAGALGEDPDGGPAFCFIRNIEPADRDRLRRGAAEGDPIRDFVDDPGEEVAESLAVLKHDLEPFTKPTHTYKVGWDAASGRPTTDHLEKFAHDVYETLKLAISEELDDPTPPRVEGREVRIEIQDHGDPKDEEARAHREFAEERIQDFVGRTELLQQIDAYLTADDPLPLVVHSDGGFGKSALLAKAVHAARGRSGPHLVYRFIGASPESTDGRSLLESLCRELARCDRNGDAEIPSDFQELTADFKDRLASATAEQPFIVFIDSLDQLAVGQGARRLTWIPQPLPEHVRFVVSTRPGDTFEPLRTRIRADSSSDRLLEVGPMSRDDGRQLLGRWLEGAHRDLQNPQRGAVLDRFESARGNPLYLRLAFEEARRWISTQAPERLDLGEPVTADHGKGTSYPKAVEAIIEHNTFSRLANEENHGEVLVSHALGYLAASRYGLAEDELLDLLSRDPDVYAWFVLNSFHVPLDLRDQLDTYLADMKPELQARAVAWSEEERRRARERGEDEPPSIDPEHVDEVSEWVRQLRDEERDRDELTAFLARVEDVPGKGLRLPVVLWSRFYADLQHYLTERAVEGAIVIDFYHRELRDVAGRCYLPATDTETVAAGTELHSRLADYFRTAADPQRTGSWTTQDGESDLRGLSELPYHLTGAERWDDVHDTLTDFTFLEQKVQHVAATTVDHDGEKTTIYRGVFALQDDFDWALTHMPGGESDTSERRRLIVTVVDLGEGLALRCPHCNTSHPATGTCPVCNTEHDLEAWKGNEIDCPNEECKGPLKVNDFIVGRD